MPACGNGNDRGWAACGTPHAGAVARLGEAAGPEGHDARRRVELQEFTQFPVAGPDRLPSSVRHWQGAGLSVQRAAGGVGSRGTDRSCERLPALAKR